MVVKLHVKLLARALPAASLAAVVMTAEYVPAARAADGANVAVLPLTLTVPATGTPPGLVARVKLVVFSVALFIGSENVANTCVLRATFVAPTAGEVAVTVGRVVSDGATVKIQVKLDASALPAASRAPVVMVAVY